MAREKSPAFQFYPKDYLTDMRVRVMTFEQRGLYWEACSICWLEGSLPADVGELAAILGCPRRRLEILWPRIAKCFEQHGERLTHKRLDKEREAQMKWAEKSSRGGSRRAEESSRDGGKFTSQTPAKHQPTTSQSAGDVTSTSSSSSSSSPSASSTAVLKSGGTPARFEPLIVSPLEFHKRHGAHVMEFCDFVCFPQRLFDEFVTRVIAAGTDEGGAMAEVTRWAKAVRQAWRDSGRIAGSDIFKFWSNEWEQTHGSNKPATGSVDVLAGLR